MVLKLKGGIVIEDLWGRFPGSAGDLRALLSGGAPAIADSHRRGFYEVEGASHVFYVHICPSGKVLLLALWPKQQSESIIRTDNRPLESAPA